VVATIAFVTFLVTENIEAVPTAFDDWTPFTVILFMLQLLFVYAALMKSPEKREADRALKGIQRRTRIRYE
jgi:hypothetical protein